MTVPIAPPKAPMSFCPVCLLQPGKRERCSPSQAAKRERCIIDLKAKNRAKGCRPEGTGSRLCPNPFAICSRAVSCAVMKVPGRYSPIAGHAKFPLGQITVTRGVNDAIAQDIQFSEFVLKSIRRHAAGDWGDLGAEDKKSNDNALKDGDRLFSSYMLERPTLFIQQPKIWIITEWDRTVTTVLFPDEY